MGAVEKTLVQLSGPYDLALSLKAAAVFSQSDSEFQPVLRKAVSLMGRTSIIEIRQVSLDPAIIEISTKQSDHKAQVDKLAQWIVLADLNLHPFYERVSEDPVLSRVVKQLHGLKPMRPASLFEMAVVAVTEQQISMLAAEKIRSRLVKRFGEQIEELWLFPSPQALGRASLEDLTACGLSKRKAEYIQGLAQRVIEGSLDLEKLKTMSDDEVRSVIGGIRGFGRWSADYILIRGLGRSDVVPVDDLGIRTFTGKYFGNGSRMSAEEVARAFEPYAPFRGIAMFYLMVHNRLGMKETE